MNIKVSIVIPVYNGEKYLTDCIESLINQKLKECEFIFINDGSIDNSSKIINHYRSIDDRIIYIEQENKGVSEARNKGIEIARGEYVGFVDADDYIEPDMFDKLYNEMLIDDIDIIISNFEEEIDGFKNIIQYPFDKNIILDKMYIQNTIMPFFIENDSLNSVCNKLYKLSLIKENKIKFPKGVALGEDGLFNMKLFSNSNEIKYIDYCGYIYREVKGSATRNLVEKDYFKRSLDTYKFNILDYCNLKLTEDEINIRKSKKFIESIMSYVYIYLKPNQGIRFKNAIKYINKMIRNQEVQESLEVYKNNFDVSGRYEKLILYGIEKKSTIILFMACTYSRLRNS